MIGVIIIQNRDMINKTWTLLYTCSTEIVTKHLAYVEYVNNCDKYEELAVLVNV